MKQVVLNAAGAAGALGERHSVSTAGSDGRAAAGAPARRSAAHMPQRPAQPMPHDAPRSRNARTAQANAGQQRLRREQERSAHCCEQISARPVSLSPGAAARACRTPALRAWRVWCACLLWRRAWRQPPARRRTRRATPPTARCCARSTCIISSTPACTAARSRPTPVRARWSARAVDPPHAAFAPAGRYVGGHERHRQMRGTFMCACCGAPLFPGDARYDSGTGCALPSPEALRVRGSHPVFQGRLSGARWARARCR